MLVLIGELNGQKIKIPVTADTGAGAPVGSIIVVCSNILPSGYLGLGVQYDITNYPVLYQVLGTDTTPTASALGLPTLSSGQYAIKATSGLTENQQENVLNTINENLSYSTTEHKTGKKWIDGRDVWSKTIYSATGYANDVTILSDNNIRQITKVEHYASDIAGLIYQSPYNDGSGNFSYLLIGSNTLKTRKGGIFLNSSFPTHTIVEYTKTTAN